MIAAIAMLLILALAAPASAQTVQFGDGLAKANVLAGMPLCNGNPGIFGSDSDQTTELNFSASFSAESDGGECSPGGPSRIARAGASQTTTVTQSGGGFTLTSAGTASAGESVCADASLNSVSELRREFTVEGGPMTYEFSGEVEGTPTATGWSSVASVTLTGATGGSSAGSGSAACGNRVQDKKPFASSGILSTGTYTLHAFMECTGQRPPANDCLAKYNLTLKVFPAGPQVKFTAGPTGAVASSTADLAFTTVQASPPPGTFECRLDAETDFSTCTSPRHLTGLAPGPHIMRVRYHPSGGLPGAAATRTWTRCPEVPVGVVKALGCFTERQKDGKGTGVFETASTAWIGGFEVRPRPGGKLVVDTKQNEVRSDGLGTRILFDGFPAPGLSVEKLPINSSDAVVEIGQAGQFTKAILDLPLKGRAKVAWAQQGRAASLDAEMELDKIVAPFGKLVSTKDVNSFANVAKLTMTLVNGTGLIVNSAEAKIAAIDVIPKAFKTPQVLGLRNVLFRYERKQDKPFWTSGALIQLPFKPGTAAGDQPIAVGGKVFMFDGSLAGGGLAADGINKEIPDTPLFLQRLAGDLVFRPDFGLNADAGATFGPRLDGAQLFTLDGTFSLGALVSSRVCRNGLDPIRLDGTIKFQPLEKDPELADFLKTEFTGRSCLYTGGETAAQEVLLQAKVELAKIPGVPGGLFGYEGSQTGLVSRAGANLEGSALVRTPFGTLDGQAIISTQGFAACGTARIPTAVQVGFGHRWGDPTPPHPFTGCDLGPFRVVVLQKASASAATRTVPAGLPAVAFAATAANGPPRLRVTGPGGSPVLSSRASGSLRSQAGLIAASATDRTTYVVIGRPKAGSWRIESLDPGVTLTKVAQSNGLPRPKLSASVTGKGARRKLHYTVARRPGQKVTFSEHASALDHPLGPAKDGRGTIAFKPAQAAAQTRTIVAHVAQDGLPRDELTVARFKVAQVKLRKPEVKAKRRTASLALSWKRVSGASSYLVEVKAGGRVLTRVLTRARKLTVRRTPARGKLAVSVQALSDVARPGPVAPLIVGPPPL